MLKTAFPLPFVVAFPSVDVVFSRRDTEAPDNSSFMGLMLIRLAVSVIVCPVLILVLDAPSVREYSIPTGGGVGASTEITTVPDVISPEVSVPVAKSGEVAMAENL